MNKIIIWTK